MSTGNHWEPTVGDRRMVEIDSSSNGIVVTAPPHVGEISIRGELPCPAERIEELGIEITERTGLAEVEAVPTGEYELVDPAGQRPDVDQWDLVEELRRLAADLGRTPTLTHVQEYSDYTREQYLEMFDSFIDALLMADLEPTMTQYNFSNREKPAEKQGTKNVRYLREHGPATSEELPASTGQQDKMHGMAKFTIPTGSRRSGTIYYLMDEHSTEEVVRKALSAYPKALERKGQKAIVTAAGNHGPEWRKTMQRILGDADSNES